LTAIGRMRRATGKGSRRAVAVHDSAGRAVKIAGTGYRHF
jgi:hypothetical protein